MRGLCFGEHEHEHRFAEHEHDSGHETGRILG